jgi:hypothetical protein
MRKLSVLVVCLTMLFAVSALAQGTSPVKVSSISVSPTSFKAGDNVTITAKLENTSANSYGCTGTTHFAVSVYVFKAAPYTVTNQVWHATQALPTALAGRERRTVTLTTRWPVGSLDTPSYHIMAWSPVCAPDEFGQSTVLTIPKTCVYQYTPRFQMMRRPIRELQLLQGPASPATSPATAPAKKK